MQVKPPHLLIGILLVAAFFSFAAFVAYMLYGPGLKIEVPQVLLDLGRATSSTESTEEEADTAIPAVPAREVLAGRPGTLFECSGNKALKAEFVEESVRLSLSDGRNLTLPQTVTSTGEVQYANANESFVFRNIGNAVFVQEDGFRTYEDCEAS